MARSGDSRTPNVAAIDCLYEVQRFDTGQDRQGELRSDAADSNQPLEQVLFEHGRETVERQRILPHVCVDAQNDLTAGLANDVERGQRHEDLIADAVDVDDDPVWLFLEDPAAQMRNHRSS